MNFDRESADEFYDKATNVQKQVEDILAGRVDLDELDKREKMEEKIKANTESVEKQKKETKLKNGKSGKGHQGGYVSYCASCQIEYTIFVAKCNHCGRDTQDEEVSSPQSKLMALFKWVIEVMNFQ